MTRIEAANLIASRLNNVADTRAAAWSKGGNVRVYVSRDSGGKKGYVEAGFIEIGFDGSVSVAKTVTFAFRYDKAVLATAVEGVVASPEAKPAIVSRPAVSADEDVAAFEESQQAMAAAESARELG